MGGTCSMQAGDEKCMCNILVRKPEGQRSHGRLTGRWKDNIKIDHEEI
jgi:hypothetical protein